MKVKHSKLAIASYAILGTLCLGSALVFGATSMEAKKHPMDPNATLPDYPIFSPHHPTPLPSTPVIPPPVTYTTLTAATVQDNFSPEGDWANKTFLTAQDLKNYNAIDFDAFNNLERELEYIELDPSITINEPSLLEWNMIKEIKLTQKRISSYGSLIISNNILYHIRRHLFTNHFEAHAISVANRNLVMDSINLTQLEPWIVEECHNQVFITISDHFYNPTTFANIKEINIDSSADGSTLITNIGDYAFYNCQILNKVSLNFNYDFCLFNLELEIGNSAFEKSNIKCLEIDSSSDAYIKTKAFADCHQLTDISINCNTASIGESAFKISQKITQRNSKLISRSIFIDPEHVELGWFSTIYNNFISGEYDQLNIAICAEPSSWMGKENTFAGINVSNQQNLKIYTLNCFEDFKVFGLDEKYNANNIIDLSSLVKGGSHAR